MFVHVGLRQIFLKGRNFPSLSGFLQRVLGVDSECHVPTSREEREPAGK